MRKIEMKNITSTTLSILGQYEEATDANIAIGRAPNHYYDLDKICLIAELKVYRATLESDDINRLFMEYGDFYEATKGGTAMVKDVLPEAASRDRVIQFTKDRFDLRSRPDRPILTVSTDEILGPLIIYDGNHRAIAQYLTYQSVHDIPVFVSVHPRISEWRFVPPLARLRTNGTLFSTR
jgi:hypothetical protein